MGGGLFVCCKKMFIIGESKTIEKQNHEHEMLLSENPGLRCKDFMNLIQIKIPIRIRILSVSGSFRSAVFSRDMTLSYKYLSGM